MNAVDWSKPISILSDFKGLWMRGIEDVCPQDHLTECLNCLFVGNNQVKNRYPLDIAGRLTEHTIVSFYGHIAKFGDTQVTNYLFLMSNGDLYDDGGTLLISWPGADDFAAVDLYGRVFLSPKRMGRALAREYTYYYDGAVHKLAGAGPSNAPTGSQSSSAGHVSVGKHLVAISYIYRYGYISPPSSTYEVSISTTDKSMDIVIPAPVVNPDIVGRIFLVSKADESELFEFPDKIFIPGGGTLDKDNLFSGTLTVDFHDTALIKSADTYSDIITEVPSVSAIKFYRGRLVLVGQSYLPVADDLRPSWNVPENILISDVTLPETYNGVDNILSVPKDYVLNAPNTAAVLRDALYIFKPHRCFVTIDNGDVPNTWSVNMIDAVVGAYDTGISTTSLAVTSQDIYDSILICDETGLMVFNGTFGERLSYKIDRLWEQIDDDKFWSVQIAHDPWLKQVYILVPICNEYVMLFMDYKDGLTANAVKWSLWKFKNRMPSKILIANVVENKQSGNVNHRLEMAAHTDTVYKLEASENKVDLGDIAIRQIVSTSPLASIPGSVSVFTAARMRIYGEGQLKISLSNEDRSRTVQYRGFALDYKGQELTRQINFMNEKMIYTIEVQDAGAWFHLNRIDIFGKSVWQMRPAVTQAL